MFRDTRSRLVGDIPEDLDAALRDPVIYPHPVERIEVEETHISKVFLTGPFVYKVKKPVDSASWTSRPWQSEGTGANRRCS